MLRRANGLQVVARAGVPVMDDRPAVHGRRTGGRRRTSAGGSKRSAAASTSGGPSAAEIRAWARENGYDVPERGRVSADVREAYAAAH